MIKTIGFIGLGSMGFGMAQQLLKHNFTVRAFDIDTNKAKLLSDQGAIACKSIKEVCLGAEIIITMLPRDEHVKDVFLSNDGVLTFAQKGSLIIEMSTILPTTSLEIKNQLEKAGLKMIDAPVGRTPEDARNGTLLIMVGGNRCDYELAVPVFNAMANKIFYLGAAGSGIQMKVINNYMSMVSMVLTAETLTMARKAGIKLNVATEVLQNTVAGRGQININFPKKVLAGDITPDFPISLGRKDLSLALKLADQLNIPLFLGSVANQIFITACKQGREQQDCTALLLAIEQLSGLKPSVEAIEVNHD